MQIGGFLKTLGFSMIISCGVVFSAVASENQAIEIYLLAELDDERGYCLDIRGYKERARIDRGLQAHTCYSYQGQVAVDQGFVEADLARGEFFIPEFDVCMSSEGRNGSTVGLAKCDGQEKQLFKWAKNGEIHPAKSDELCLMVGSGKPRQGRGGRPRHLMRDLKFDRCLPELADYQRWGMRSGSHP